MTASMRTISGATRSTRVIAVKPFKATKTVKPASLSASVRKFRDSTESSTINTVSRLFMILARSVLKGPQYTVENRDLATSAQDDRQASGNQATAMRYPTVS